MEDYAHSLISADFADFDRRSAAQRRRREAVAIEEDAKAAFFAAMLNNGQILERLQKKPRRFSLPNGDEFSVFVNFGTTKEKLRFTGVAVSLYKNRAAKSGTELPTLLAGVAVCHPPDLFCKKTGKIIAVKKIFASEGCPLSREERRIVWRSIFCHNDKEAANR